MRSLEVAWRSKARRASSRDHAVAVVGDADELAAAGFDLDADAGGSGVEGVFEEFFDDGGGALDDLAGGDLVRHEVGEDADAAHDSIVRGSALQSGLRGACDSDAISARVGNGDEAKGIQGTGGREMIRKLKDWGVPDLFAAPGSEDGATEEPGHVFDAREG